MTSRFDNKGDGDQNIAQGDGAIGKQENHYYNRPLKPRTLLLVVVLLAGISGASYSLFAPAEWFAFTVRDNASTQGGSSPATVAGHDAIVNYNTGVTPDAFARYAGELAVTDAALSSFFKLLEEQQVPRSDLDSKLRDIAKRYKELLKSMKTEHIEDQQMLQVKQETQRAIEDRSATTPLSYLEERLHIRRKVGDLSGEQATLSNIGAIYTLHRFNLNFFESLKIRSE
jgi:hypothetical protein